MEKVRIVVVEDEILFAEELVDYLSELGYEVFGPAISYTEAWELIQREKPDLLLTDIQLSGKKSGIDLVETLRKEMDIPVIFLTSYYDKETIDKARENKPHAYLVKPYNKGELYAAIELAIDKHQEKKAKKQLLVKTRDYFVKISIDEILFVQSDHIYLDLFTSNKKYVVRQSLADFANLYQEHFIRVHRSFVVNKKQIESFSSEQVIVGGHSVPIGKNYQVEVKAFLSN